MGYWRLAEGEEGEGDWEVVGGECFAGVERGVNGVVYEASWVESGGGRGFPDWGQEADPGSIKSYLFSGDST